jgi:hypothetical protein
MAKVVFHATQVNKGKCNFMIEHIDKLVLEVIKSKLELGPNIIRRSSRERDIGKDIKGTYMLNISSKKDINTLISLLDDNIRLKGYKLIQYNQ